jgi:hypothetical protein
MLNIQLSKLVNIIIGNIEYNSLEGGGIFGRGWGRLLEKPNSRRSTSKESWSGVTRVQLKERNFFLKK